MEATIKAIHEKPIDHVSFSITKTHEKWFLSIIEENTELSTIDFIHAQRREFTEDGEDKIEYKWKLTDIPESKYQSFAEFATAVFILFHEKATHTN